MQSFCTKKTFNSHLKEARKLEEFGIYISQDEDNMYHIYALIIGGQDTPYAGGFFFFEFNFKNDYPNNPPHCTFFNTNIINMGRVNPNTYQSSLHGKVCLSILGTWGENTWDKNHSSFGEILLNLKAIVFVSDPLQKCEPPYNHLLIRRNAYSYSVEVLTLSDYILGTYIKMKAKLFKREYTEAFEDIIYDYINNPENIKNYRDKYNNLLLKTKILMDRGHVNRNGVFKQAFYQIQMCCNIPKISKMFEDVFGPIGILSPDIDISSIESGCLHINKMGINKGCQCKKKIFKDDPYLIYCTTHEKKYSDKLTDAPAIQKLLNSLDNPFNLENPLNVTKVKTKVETAGETEGETEGETKVICQCMARTSKPGHPQCSRQGKFNTENGHFCGTHVKKQPYGIIEKNN